MEYIKNIYAVPKEIKELILEMLHSIENESYPSYNAAMLLYRPILIHILKEDGVSDYHSYNYGDTIRYLCERYELSSEERNDLFTMKDFVNKINHNCEVVMDEDVHLVHKAWDIIKNLVEKIY